MGSLTMPGVFVAKRTSMFLIALAASAGVHALEPAPALAGCGGAAGVNVDWTGCRKRALIVSGTNFEGAKLVSTDFTGSDLRNTVFKDANLTKATLTRSSISGAQFKNARLSGVEGIRLSAKNAEFQSVTMDKTMFFRADFRGAQMNEVNFSKAEFSRANFSGARIEETTLEFSNLSRVKFNNAELISVNLTGAWTYLTDFRGVDLRETTGLTQAQLQLSCGDADTLLPPGLRTPVNWPCAFEDDS
ncbi:MAG: pentapeptide repeat-containing protein [Pseudomonadota bacterium]